MGFLSSTFGYLLDILYEIFSNYGVAIILFSIILRIILIPITVKQQITMKKSEKLQGKLKVIQEKYKNDPEKLNKETMELYKTENMSPLSGCFGSILQLIIILSVFWLVSQPLTYMKKVDPEVINDYKTQIQEENENQRTSYPEIAVIDRIENEYIEVNQKLEDENVENKEELEEQKAKLESMRINMEFAGLDLSKVPTQNLTDWRVYVIPLLYVVTTFISIRLTTKKQNKKNKTKLLKENNSEINEEEVLSQDDKQDAMSQMGNTMQYMMPIMSITIALVAPLGLALYWLISNILMIVERLVIDKFINSKEDKKDVK